MPSPRLFAGVCHLLLSTGMLSTTVETSGLLFKLNLGASSLAATGDGDYDSAVANSPNPSSAPATGFTVKVRW